MNLSKGQTYVFRTPHLPTALEDRKLNVVDVLLAATAAPTYFPHKVMPDGDAYCDGALWAVDPAILAVAEAFKIRQFCTRPECDPAYDTCSFAGIAAFSAASQTPQFLQPLHGVDAYYIVDMFFAESLFCLAGLGLLIRTLLWNRTCKHKCAHPSHDRGSRGREAVEDAARGTFSRNPETGKPRCFCLFSGRLPASFVDRMVNNCRIRA